MTNTEIETQLRQTLTEKAAQTTPLLVAIDGRCAAGKTTLAAALGRALSATVLHMDDFFLRPEQRTQHRLQQPGGNVDYERFLAQVLTPLRQNQPFFYQPYHCQTGQLAQGEWKQPAAITIVEGAYACHPALRSFYDYRVLVSVPPKAQMQRIVARNPAAVQAFATRWIPLEEAYLAGCDVAACCHAVFESEVFGGKMGV